MTRIATSNWFKKLDPNTYCRIGISRGVPRGQSGFRRYPKLNPGPWFLSVPMLRYNELYFREILGPLNAGAVADELAAMAGGRIPVLLCWEPPQPGEKCCHRGLVAAWFKDQIDLDVYEVGQEHEGAGWAHPKLHPTVRKTPGPVDQPPLPKGRRSL